MLCLGFIYVVIIFGLKFNCEQFFDTHDGEAIKDHQHKTNGQSAKQGNPFFLFG